MLSSDRKTPCNIRDGPSVFSLRCRDNLPLRWLARHQHSQVNLYFWINYSDFIRLSRCFLSKDSSSSSSSHSGGPSRLIGGDRGEAHHSEYQENRSGHWQHRGLALIFIMATVAVSHLPGPALFPGFCFTEQGTVLKWAHSENQRIRLYTDTHTCIIFKSTLLIITRCVAAAPARAPRRGWTPRWR